MSTEIKPCKLKVVFCVIDRATGKPVAGTLPVDGDEMFQLVVQSPPPGIEHVPEDKRESWIGDICSAAGVAAGKKIASVLTSLILDGSDARMGDGRALPDIDAQVSILRDRMQTMTDDERWAMIQAVGEGYCLLCGGKEPDEYHCQCRNDE
jgi:hypothetical protein